MRAKIEEERNPKSKSALSRVRGARPPGGPYSSNPMASASTPTSELAMQSPAPASSLVELLPAACPQLGQWICQQGPAIRENPGSAAAAAAAAASTTALALLRLFIFRTGMIILTGYSMCTSLLYCHVTSLLLYPARRVCRLPFVDGLGWMTTYLNNSYGYILPYIRVVLAAWYEKLKPGMMGMIVLDAKVTYDRSIGRREAFVQEAACFVSFSDPRVGSAGPARGAPARQGPSCRQL